MYVSTTILHKSLIYYLTNLIQNDMRKTDKVIIVMLIITAIELIITHQTTIGFTSLFVYGIYKYW